MEKNIILGGGLAISSLTTNIMSYKNLNNIISEEINEINVKIQKININLLKINDDLKSSSFMKRHELIKLKKEKVKLENEKKKLENERQKKEFEKQKILNNENREFKQEREEKRQQEEELQKEQLRKQEEKIRKKQQQARKQQENRQKLKQDKRKQKDQERKKQRQIRNKVIQKRYQETQQMGLENQRSKLLTSQRELENKNMFKEILSSKVSNNILCKELKQTLSSFSLENIPNIQNPGHYFIDKTGKIVIKDLNDENVRKNPYYYAENSIEGKRDGLRFIKTLFNKINKTDEIIELNQILCKLFIIIGFINNYELKDDKFIILLKGKRAIQYLLKNKSYDIKTTDIDILIKYKNEEYEYDELEIYEKTIYIGSLICELLNNNKILFSTDSLSGIENVNNKKEFIKDKRNTWNELNNKRGVYNPYIFKILYDGSPIMDLDMRNIKHETIKHFENLRKDYISLKLINGKIIDLLYYTQSFDQLLNETNYYLSNQNKLSNYNLNKITKKKIQMNDIRNKKIL